MRPGLIKSIFQKPAITIILATGLVGFAATVTGSILMANGPGLVDGLGAILMLEGLTVFFILLPVWIVAALVKSLCRRNGVAYEWLRSWIWAPAALSAGLLAAYVGFAGEQLTIDVARGNGDDMAGLIFYIFYIFAAVLVAVAGGLLAMYRIAVLKKQGVTNGGNLPDRNGP